MKLSLVDRVGKSTVDCLAKICCIYETEFGESCR